MRKLPRLFMRRESPQVFRRLMAGGEGGQLVIVAAVAMLVVLVAAAIAIDTGSWAHTRTKLQADVDAMALSGAQKCGTTGCRADARELARDYGPLNGLELEEIEFIRSETGCIGDCNVPTTCLDPGGPHITVQAKRTKPSLIAQIAGIDSADLRACATSGPTISFAVSGFKRGVRPFALDGRCMGQTGVAYGSTVTLKFDSSDKNNCNTTQGNFASIMDANSYLNSIMYGNNTALCTNTTPGCCQFAGPSCNIGVFQISTLTGDKIGPTKSGIDYLINNTSTTCNTWEKVQTSGVLNPDCVPWSPTYTGANCGNNPGQNACPTRLLIVPVVSELFASGSHPITITGFAIVFLEGYAGNNCTGNNCDIRARFIRTIGPAEWVSAKTPCGGNGQPVCTDLTTVSPTLTH